MQTRTLPGIGTLGVLVLILVMSSASGAHAQGLPAPGDGFTWERVGDRAIDVEDLTFGPDSTLWAAAGDGAFRLDTTDSSRGVWRLTSEYPFVNALIVLGRGAEGDTLVAGEGYTHRSTDGGRTWQIVHDQGYHGLYEIPAGLPHAGRILTGATSHIAYSDDRAASFTPSVVPGQPGSYGGADDFVALPPDSEHPGRILAAGTWGVNVSDDGGQTFRESALWRAVYYFGEAIGFAGRPIAAGVVNAQADARVWTSDDGGQAWGPGDGLHLVEGPPLVTDGSAVAVLALGGDSALVVLKGGTVYRTSDAGETWTPIGRAPQINAVPRRYASAAALGPDGRLYVGLHEQGVEQAWAWRTHERLTVTAAEPAPVPAEDVLRVEVAPNPFRDEATVTLTLAQPSEVTAAVYDVLGRRVAILADTHLAAGRHVLPWTAGRLAPGVYVVHVAAGRNLAARTVTLLR